MRTYNLFLFALLLNVLIPATKVSAQKFDEDFFKEHLNRKHYAIDSEANAVVLYEKGSVEIVPYADSYQQLFHVHKIIKILNASAVNEELINLVIHYYTYGEHDAGVKGVKATTYNLEGSKVIKTPVGKDNIYQRKLNDRFSVTEFSMPAIKNGSIVDYEYTISSNVHYVPPSWEFQDEIPKLVSEYEIATPASFGYNSIFQGDYSFKEYHSEKKAQEDAVSKYTVIFPTSIDHINHILWVEKNVTPLKEEPYVSNVKNYIELLELQLSGLSAGYYQDNDEILTTWPKLDDKLWRDERFGRVLVKQNKDLDATVQMLIQGKDTPLEKAKAIFSFVRATFTSNNYRSIYAGEDNNLNKIFEKKNGSEAEINLLLTSMLRKAGLKASPVVLSQVGELRCHEIYPLLSRFNYVVTVLDINDDYYWLDAAHKFNPFGTLPQRCYNGYTRVIDDGQGTGVDLTSNDIKEKNSYYINMVLTNDTGSKIDVVEKPGIFYSSELRKKWNKDSLLIKEYVKSRMQAISGTLEIGAINIYNLSNPDTNLVICYTLNIKDALSATTYLNTDVVKFFKENPFTAMTRHLPIELPYKMEDHCIMNIRLPDDYNVTDMPAPVNVIYGGDDMIFKHLLSYDSTLHILSVSTRFTANKTTYPMVEYENIRTFFEKMVQAQEGRVVVKKN